MELSHGDYVRMGQLVTITAIASAFLYGVLRRTMRGRRLMLWLSRQVHKQVQRSSGYGITVATLMFLASIALLCFFFKRFLSSMPDTLRGDTFSFVKVSVWLVGGLLSMDLVFAAGMLLVDSVRTGFFRRRHPPAEEETV